MPDALHLIWIGATLLLALAALSLAQRMHVPRVTLLLLLGAIAGPEILDLMPAGASDSFGLITQITLGIVGFLLGERMSFRDLKQARESLIISLAVTFVTAACVALAVWLLTGDWAAALLLGAISTATDPAASIDVMKESHADGPLTRLLIQVVAIDDAWGVVLFSIVLVILSWIAGGDESPWIALGHGSVEVLGSLALGAVMGLPMAWLTGRLTPGEPMLLESIGFVLLAAGLAHLLGLSYLLTCIALGVVVANVARHHVRPFRSIEGIAFPFLALFFFMAGYQLDWSTLPTLGLLGLLYIAARIAGRLLGGYMGGWMASSARITRRRIGACMLPQAGVALGLALVATERFPELSYLLPLVVAVTVLFELIGPPITLHELKRAHETESKAHE
ncbi:cation:proton antiporter [Wenzhouxiangella marina]|uniref:Sodium/hydrogen exchanger n=1 Tax=Wenzhouxiangella marina TaxID=1579979 RepID=A0A0K0XUN7_9GAMM|nr:cation:proton antiporter [Wenzhouxiangella marina]AKS41337.1 Sodium/hydrogen exchanger [Wenzhouxiangella marina]MBB6086913.1 Kef-type K+ transport system membrane component KefB [Wenzhouxiangella marina]